MFVERLEPEVGDVINLPYRNPAIVMDADFEWLLVMDLTTGREYYVDTVSFETLLGMK